MPQCSDGRDNDGDGKIDYPNDPGCFSPQEDSEVDDCPTGPQCPQCSDGIDNDGNGLIDDPNDPGCSSAADDEEFTENPVACGANVMIKQMPSTNEDTSTLGAGSPSGLSSTTCGGAGPEVAYEIQIHMPQVLVASTDNQRHHRRHGALSPHQGLHGRGDRDDVQRRHLDERHELDDQRQALQPGTYYLIVDSSSSTGGAYDLTVKYFVGEGVACTTDDMCGPGLVCRIPVGGTMKVCSKHRVRGRRRQRRRRQDRLSERSGLRRFPTTTTRPTIVRAARTARSARTARTTTATARSTSRPIRSARPRVGPASRA